LALTAENGRLVVVGHQPNPVAVDFKLVSMGEREILGTMAHVFATDLPLAVEQISSDLEAWARVAPTVYPLEDVVQSGLEPMSRGASPQIKVLFDPTIEAPRPLATDKDN
jgi:threonine dehydrogenase-like Zn-dependent dehydrogenase